MIATSILKARPLVAKMKNSNTYTYQRVLRFLEGSDHTLDLKERKELRRIIETETNQILARL